MELPSSPLCEYTQPPFTLRSASLLCYPLPPNTQGVLSRSRRGRGGEGRGAEGRTEREAEVSMKDNMAARTEPEPGLLTLREKRPPPPQAPPPQALPPRAPGLQRQNRAELEEEWGGSGGVSGQVGGVEVKTDSRKLNLTSQSERGGVASPEDGGLTGEGETTTRRAESLETREEGEGGGRESQGLLTRALNCDPSGLGAGEGRMGAAERAAGCLSLPSRLRPQPGNRSQSIWERIDKLYGSEKTERPSAPMADWPLAELDGCGSFIQRRKSATDFLPTSSPISQWRRGSCEWGGSFPRRLVRGERTGVDAAQSSRDSPSSASPGSALGRERAPGEPCPGQAQGKPPDLGQSGRRRGMLEYNTRSLDRASSKLTVAALRRADWAAQIPSGKDSSKPLTPGHREERERRNNDVTNDGERQGAVGRGDERVGERESPACKTELEKVSYTPEPPGVNLGSKLFSTNQMNSRATSDPSTRAQACCRGLAREGSITEDVFEPSPQRGPAQSSSRGALVVPSVASVKNKIHQFEALTQKTQRDFQKPRRALSVPEHLGRKAGEGASQAWRGDLGGRRGRWEGEKEEKDGVDSGGEKMKGADEVKGSGPALGRLGELGGAKGGGGERERGWTVRSASVDETGLRWEREAERREREAERREREAKREMEAERREREAERRGREAEGVWESGRDKEREVEASKLKDKMEIPLSRGTRERPSRICSVDETSRPAGSERPSRICSVDETSRPAGSERPSRICSVDETSRPAGSERPFPPQNRRKEATSTKLLNSSSPERAELQHTARTELPSPAPPELPSPAPPELPSPAPPELPSPISDDDLTPTNTPHDSPFYPPQETLEVGRAQGGRGGSPAFTAQPLTSGQESNSHVERDSLVPPLPLSSLPQSGGDLDAWLASLNRKIERWDSDDEGDDDEGTEKDEDSNYDSDESSVTITSNMSQSDRRSFCLSLAELCNFGGVEYESEAEMEAWPPGRSASLSSDVSALSCVSVLDNEELDRLLDDVRSLGDDTLQNYEDVQVVVLHKEVGIGLGFTVAGGEDQNKPITVHRVFSSGVAAQEGSIREGDLILSINGTSLSGSAHWQALRTLRKARTLGMGVVVLRRGVASKLVKGVTGVDLQGCKQTPPTNTGQRLCVHLEKGSRDLGFSLEGGLGCSQGDRPIRVQKIFLGGPVTKVCPGDELLEIQGVSVVGMRRLEAWTLIRRLPPGPVEVVLQRPLPPSVGVLQS